MHHETVLDSSPSSILPLRLLTFLCLVQYQFKIPWNHWYWPWMNPHLVVSFLTFYCPVHHLYNLLVGKLHQWRLILAPHTILLVAYLALLFHIERACSTFWMHPSLLNQWDMIIFLALFMGLSIILPHHMIIFKILCCSNHPCLLPCLPLKAFHCWTHYHHSVHLENPLVYQYQLCHFIITHQHCSQVWAQLIQLLVAFYWLLMMIQWTSQIRC